MSTLTFEEDYESNEFKARNVVQFSLRDQNFKVARLTMQQLQDAATEAAENPKRTTTLEDWFKRRLAPKDFDRFWKLVNTKGNPVRIGTLTNIINAVERELQGLGAEDDEDAPKE